MLILNNSEQNLAGAYPLARHLFDIKKFNYHDNNNDGNKFSKCSSHDDDKRSSSPTSYPKRSYIYSLSQSSLLFIIIIIMCIRVISCEQTFERINSPVVSTKYGLVRGRQITLPSLSPINVFLGIPYAHPPTDKFRFMPPGTPALWNGVRNAHNPSPVCPQVLPDIDNKTEALKHMTKGRLNILKRILPLLQNQSEDCLYLNIYAPIFGSNEKRRFPVMVFIHGESYEWNSGSVYDGSVLSSVGKVIVVTLNYRLGVLGFFPPLDDATSRGNFGLMDQVAALHWIQENIESFGGSKNNVTIFGHDYGAVFVNLLMLSSMAQGLFQRAIMQSGSALSPFALARKPAHHGRFLGKKLDCPSEPHQNVLLMECLRKKSVQQLLSVKFQLPTHLTFFGPTVDGIVIAKDPAILMNDPKSPFANYDLMAGVNHIESYNLFNDNDDQNGLEIVQKERIIRTLIRNLYDYHLQEIYLTLSNEYTDWNRPASYPLSVLDSTLNLLDDALVVAPLIRVVNYHAAKNNRNTYFYNFLYTPEQGSDYPSRLGSISGQELMYIFGAPLLPSNSQFAYFSKSNGKSEASSASNMIKYWTNFAKFGNPDGEAADTKELSKLTSSTISSKNNRSERILWPVYEQQNQKYLAILMPEPEIRDHYRAHRMSYWLNLIPRINMPSSTSISSGSQDHHLLLNHHDSSSYYGIVRPTVQRSNDNRANQTPQDSSISGLATGFLGQNDVSRSASQHGLMVIPGALSENNSSNYRQSALDSHSNGNGGLDKNSNNSLVILFGHRVNYSTALSVTIGIGCSLLILNALVCAGVFYRKDRKRMKASRRKVSSGNNNDDNRNESSYSHHQRLNDDGDGRMDKSQDSHNTSNWRISRESDHLTLAYYHENSGGSFMYSDSNDGMTDMRDASARREHGTLGTGQANLDLTLNHTGVASGAGGGDGNHQAHNATTWLDHRHQTGHQQQGQSLDCSMDKGYQSSMYNPYIEANIDILEQTGVHQSGINKHGYTMISGNGGGETNTILRLDHNQDKSQMNRIDENSGLMLIDHHYIAGITETGGSMGHVNKAIPNETGI
ncbi:neuroligin-4, X-linked-like [Brevipalpus obovatus]|uniref:neuroligin-4, X-linked-like n=1 Tax=Brevipalpus obovatus TaxID=246614 RepID=UPI003D9DE7CD